MAKHVHNRLNHTGDINSYPTSRAPLFLILSQRGIRIITEHKPNMLSAVFGNCFYAMETSTVRKLLLSSLSRESTNLALGVAA
jgi:hypothetical protein